MILVISISILSVVLPLLHVILRFKNKNASLSIFYQDYELPVIIKRLSINVFKILALWMVFFFVFVSVLAKVIGDEFTIFGVIYSLLFMIFGLTSILVPFPFISYVLNRFETSKHCANVKASYITNHLFAHLMVSRISTYFYLIRTKPFEILLEHKIKADQLFYLKKFRDEIKKDEFIPQSVDYFRPTFFNVKILALIVFVIYFIMNFTNMMISTNLKFSYFDDTANNFFGYLYKFLMFNIQFGIDGLHPKNFEANLFAFVTICGNLICISSFFIVGTEIFESTIKKLSKPFSDFQNFCVNEIEVLIHEVENDSFVTNIKSWQEEFNKYDIVKSQLSMFEKRTSND